jgi:hypothetical protein
LAWEKRPNLGLAAEAWGLSLLGLALAGASRAPGLLAPTPARAALIGLGLFGAALALKQNSPRLTAVIPLAFLGLWFAIEPGLAGLTAAAAGAGFFYLALSLLAGRSDLPSRRLAPWLALAFFNMALVCRLFEAPLGGLSPWTGLSLIWAMESVILSRLGHGRAGALVLMLAALAAALIPDRFSGAPVSQFLLASATVGIALIHAAARAASHPGGRPDSKKPAALTALGLGAWLAGLLATAWGAASSSATPVSILNWLLTAGSLFSLVLWLAGQAAPALLISRRPGRPPLLVLAQVTPLLPALALTPGFLWSFLQNSPPAPDGLDPAAWLLWALAQSLGLAQARRFTRTPLWSNVFLLTLALALSQAAAVQALGGPAFGQDMGRLAAFLAVLALCAKPPRLIIFQDLSLCRAAGHVLSGLILWQGLTLILDPAARPGFFGFIPVLNLTNLIHAASFWLPVAFFRRLTAPARPPAINFLQAALFFIWLNVVLARAVHHLSGVPYQAEALFSSPIFWTVFIIVWSALALGVRLARGRGPDETKPYAI